MNTFKQKSLYAALAGLGALGATGVAQAVSVNQDGLGQVLIYPYYTVRGSDGSRWHRSPRTTRCCRSSTRPPRRRPSRSASSKARTAAKSLTSTCTCRRRTSGRPRSSRRRTAPASSRRTSPARCPKVSTSSSSPTAFVNYAFTGSNDDKGGTSLDRTREGYVEIIEMGDVDRRNRPDRHPRQRRSALHGVVADRTGRPDQHGPGHGRPVRLDDAHQRPQGRRLRLSTPPRSTASRRPRCGSLRATIRPTLAYVNPKTSVVVAGFNVYVTPSWPTLAPGNPVDPVSAVLMHNNVYNEFVLDVSTKSETDWVVTFPTKREYVFAGIGRGAEALPEQLHRVAARATTVLLTQYDREERTIVSQTSFSPPPPTQTDSLCWEANVISYVYPTSARPRRRIDGLRLEELLDRQDGLRQRLGCAGLPAHGRHGRHQLVGPGSTVFNTRTGVRSARPRRRRSTVCRSSASPRSLRKRHADDRSGTALQSNYGGNFNHKLTTSIVAVTRSAQ